MKVWRIIYESRGGVTEKLAQRNNCTVRTVQAALGYRSNSELAKAIREDCLKNFGGKRTQIELED